MADISITTASKPRSAAATAEPAPELGAPYFDLIELLFFAYRDFVGDADEVLAKLGFGAGRKKNDKAQPKFHALRKLHRPQKLVIGIRS
jgi:hypothetical protein